MHKYRIAAKQAAWYNDEEDDNTYNPFRKTRLRAKSLQTDTLLSATQSDEEVHKSKATVLSDAGFTNANQSTVQIRAEDLEPRRQFRISEGSPQSVRRKRKQREFPGIPWSISSGLWQSLADIGKSMPSRAHSESKDAPLLENPSRPLRFMVIEYAKQEDDVKGTRYQ